MILEPKKRKPVTVSIVSPFICHEVMVPDAMIFIFGKLNFKPGFHSILSLSSKDSLVPLHFYYKHGVIYISEVINISPGSLDSNCASSSLAFCMMYSEYKLNKQGDNIQL